MPEDFAFRTEVDSSMVSGYDAQISPGATPLEADPPHTPLPVTPLPVDSASSSRNSGAMDVLVHKLSRQTLRQISQQDSQRSLHMEAEEPVESADSTWTQLQAPISALGPIPESPMQVDSSQPPQPRVGNHSTQQVQESESQLGKPQTEDAALCKHPEHKKLRRQTETRPNKSASNLRTLSLVTGMIENGVQCNVQAPASATPTTIPPIYLPCRTTYIKPDSNPIYHMRNNTPALEIDPECSEQDHEALLHDTLGLRYASAPAGISKYGFQRHRSASEAAAACKNMKRNVVRMRRRKKTTD
ncbi:Uu.00g098480.m01.CDS01 [Anthostomella pinea]|uniref:Uu.00g098480.m01.CDS01 n=1 Tax=Anthostomella pinea TaxID=933095 RepID=A0AAI8YCQ9_9PEZI|nr:Uu.00g098480.m01.CDS01 [Anthostomella pinea]